MEADLQAGAGADYYLGLQLAAEHLDEAQAERMRLLPVQSRGQADAIILHPGPMVRGVEIASDIADDVLISLIAEQVEMGVAIRMAILDALSRGLA